MPDIQLLNCDCMDYMADLENNAFELAIVDPPYGIGNFIPQEGRERGDNFKTVQWNDDIPPEQYFSELKRISSHQIIWGANYYNCFGENGGAIIWDKKQENPKLSRCEIASISMAKRVAYIDILWAGCAGAETRTGIHPCEKPVKLYEWLLANYAKEGNRILDTHLGSGSSAIAAHYSGYDFVGMEIDTNYYNAAVNRFNQETRQLDLLEGENV